MYIDIAIYEYFYLVVEYLMNINKKREKKNHTGPEARKQKVRGGRGGEFDSIPSFAAAAAAAAITTPQPFRAKLSSDEIIAVAAAVAVSVDFAVIVVVAVTRASGFEPREVRVAAAAASAPRRATGDVTLGSRSLVS